MQPSRRDLIGAGLAGAAALTGCASDGDAPVSDVIGNLDGVGLAARIRTKEITPLEALEAAIARAERVNPTLNFMATKAYEYARARAPADPVGPFAGVPTLIKDLIPLAGVRFMEGSRAYASRIAERHGAYVDALLRAGLNPFGKSTTPEFGLTCTTEPLVTGQTKNPWDITRIAGGSSGGAAAAVAAGVIPVAHASDGGGSVRIPASLCGLVGLKLSRGREIADPFASPPLVDTDVNGCVSRTVRDTAAWLAATERQGVSAIMPPVGVVSGPSSRRLRIGFTVTEPSGGPADAQVRAALEDVARTCSQLGHQVSEAPPIGGEAFTEAFILLWSAGAAQTAAAIIAANPGRAPEEILEPLTLQLAAQYQRTPRGALDRAVRTLRQAEAAYVAAFRTYHVMLTPVTAGPAAKLGDMAPTLPFDVGFARVRAFARFTPLANVAGGCAITLPLAWSAENLPIGAQFVAPRGAERTLLELAFELEHAMPWAQRKPPVWAGT
jgi:amidase